MFRREDDIEGLRDGAEANAELVGKGFFPSVFAQSEQPEREIPLE